MRYSQFNRRQFLRRSSLIAIAPTVPAFLDRTVHAAEANYDGRILVVIQLSGGNDGINTVVPYADEGYKKHRDKLRLSTESLVKLNDHVGLHPALRPISDLFEDGRLAIVQGVGYPNPSRSHDVSMAIWQTARFDSTEHKTFGWIGRAMDAHSSPADGAPHSILLGDESPPIALRGRRSTAVSLAHLDDLKLKPGATFGNSPHNKTVASDTVDDSILAFSRRALLDAYSTADLIDEIAKRSQQEAAAYPQTGLANRLKSIAQLIKADFATPIYYAVQAGYDTHAAQLPKHARLLGELAGAIQAFFDDLKAAALDERVLLLCFSEFGRPAAENASLGTDHGTSGPVIVAGSRVKPGLIGQTPSLTDTSGDDLNTHFDFRQIYASILEDWIGVPSEPVLGGNFGGLDVIK